VTNEKIEKAVQAYVANEQTIKESIPSEYQGTINQTVILKSIQISGKLLLK
jgi:hypothetical protein